MGKEEQDSASIPVNGHTSTTGGKRIRKPWRPLAELFGAIHDHRNWIDSGRARLLGATFERSGQLATYAAYLLLAYLAYTSWLDIRTGLGRGRYLLPDEFGDAQSALFQILAAGLLLPLVAIALYIGIGWLYNLAVAAAYRTLPRFARPIVHPAILAVVAATLAAYQSDVNARLARTYLYAKATVAAANSHVVYRKEGLVREINVEFSE